MTRLLYIGEFPLMAGLSDIVRDRKLEDEPRFAWTSFARADGQQYRALVAWLPVVDSGLVFQFCPVHPPRAPERGIATWSWEWDGNIERPTLKESIQCTFRPPNPQYHGHIIRGFWSPCS